MIEIQPPHRVTGHYNSWPTLFLAGSIELNAAERWQDRVVKDLDGYDVAIFNPRRDNWNNTITQRASDPQFAEQVNWELDNIVESDIVGFYFDPSTKSPITLLELGMVSVDVELNRLYDSPYPNVVVCCPDGFWRKGNVEIVCERLGLKLVESYQDFIDTLSKFINDANLSPA